MNGPAARSPKRERLVTAAGELVYRQGVARTTLADIAAAADVPLGNVYYYFKTKDDIVDAVVDTHVQQLTTDIAELERRHRNPKTRLKALVGLVLAQRCDVIAQYGCPFGTLTSELAKHADGSDQPAAALMEVSLDWAERQLRAMGRRDAHDLAVELVVGFQGTTVLANALGKPELVARQARRLEKWIDAL
ncbi:transcriptional regulator [Mycobacterium sp. JS623]|uniref:TetR/AcrR family transcriptional regulator n=1 Tax=Mycobacterium sp. JS623 TaxID=212767 RepID=UPI0002A5AAC7|nr:TetR/AcrR family transcriptional regulator [Mycobacterium sp. JS623]AGB23412.1 transcriptional regulator [Mycobacterium sp. JS623]